MVSVIKKIYTSLQNETRNRGIYYAVLMNFSYLFAVLRGLFYQCLYLKNVRASIFALQKNSKIEIFNKRSQVTIGKFVFIRKNVSVRLDFNGELFIDDKVFINDNCTINCVNKITIGKYTKIAPNVCINDHDHNYKQIDEQHLVKGEVIIGKNVWIGSNVVILKDTTIGDNAVIAAGSVVKGHVPPNTLFLNKREVSLIDFERKNKVRGIL